MLLIIIYGLHCDELSKEIGSVWEKCDYAIILGGFIGSGKKIILGGFIGSGKKTLW